MKTLSPALKQHLGAELSTLALLIKITCVDGQVMGFTSHDAPITLNAITYQASGAFQASAIENRAGLSTDNLDILGLLQSDGITSEDLRDGRYDHARVDIYLCNWADISQGVMQMRRGWLGEVRVKDTHYEVELRGLHDLLQRPIGKTYTPECRHDLGDVSCGITLSGITVSGNVTASSHSASFTDTARNENAGLYDYGLLRWMSGANTGLSMEVKRFEAQHFTLWLPMPRAIAVGDAYTVHHGCDKRFATCQNRFANTLNFGGFPHLPGVDRVLNYPDA